MTDANVLNPLQALAGGRLTRRQAIRKVTRIAIGAVAIVAIGSAILAGSAGATATSPTSTTGASASTASADAYTRSHRRSTSTISTTTITSSKITIQGNGGAGPLNTIAGQSVTFTGRATSSGGAGVSGATLFVFENSAPANDFSGSNVITADANGNYSFVLTFPVTTGGPFMVDVSSMSDNT